MQTSTNALPNGPPSNKISPFDTKRSSRQDFTVMTQDRKELPDPNLLVKNSNDYFNEVSYLVDLTHLYKRIKTCYHDDYYEQIPIFFEMDVKEMIDENRGCSYMIQIWDKNKQLKCQVPLKQNNRQIKLRNLPIESKDMLFFTRTGQYLVIANHSKIWITDYESNIHQNKQYVLGDIDCAKFHFETHQTKQKIVGMFSHNTNITEEPQCEDQICIMFETSQSVLDFNSLVLNREVSAENSIYLQQFKQQADIYQRAKKAQNVGKVYAITLLTTGQIDFYQGMGHKQYVDEIFEDIEMSLVAFYVKSSQFDHDYTYYQIKHNSYDDFSYEQKTKILDKDFKMELVHQRILQHYVDIFKGFIIIEYQNQTLCLIAHNKFLSAYDIMTGEFVKKHLVLPDQIDRFFYQFNIETYVDVVCVLLKNSIVIYNIEKYFKSDPVFDLRMLPEDTKGKDWESLDIDYTGTLQIGRPYQGILPWLLVYNQDQIKCVHNFQVFTAQAPQLPISALALYQDCSVMESAQWTHNFVLISNQKYTLCSITPKSMLKQGQTEVIQIKQVLAYDREYGYNCPCSFDQIVATGFKSNKSAIVHIHDKFIRVFNPSQNEQKSYVWIEIKGAKFVSQDINYILCKENQQYQEYGLMMLNLEKTITEKNLVMTQIKQLEVGVDPSLTVFQIDRIGFLTSLNTYMIVPYLHQDFNQLMGKQGILLKSVLDVGIGQFNVVLDYENNLHSWTLHNGKLFEKIQISKSIIDLSQYQIIQTYFQKETGYMFKNLNTDISEDAYSLYFPQELLNPVESLQKTMLQQDIQCMKEWVVIRITAYNKIEFITFEFPRTNNQVLRVNDTMTKMIAQFEEKRILVYTALADKNRQNHVIWKLERLMTDYPRQFDSNQPVSYPNFLTPSFNYFLRFYKKMKQFKICDVLTGQPICEISDQILSAQDAKEAAQKVITLFKFINDKTFKVFHEVNGIEIVYEISEGQGVRLIKDTKYNFCPLYEDLMKQLVESIGFYNSRLDFFQIEQLKRLQIFYVYYKSDYYLNVYPDVESKCQLIYQQDINNTHQSFTFLHYQLAEKLSRKEVNVKDITDEDLQLLLYNIFPGGKNFLHMLKDNLSMIQEIFERCHTAEEIKYHIPIFPDFENETLFSLCLSKSGLSDESTEKRRVFNLLKYLKLYGIDHHSRCIQDFYAVIISTKTQVALDYFESRFQQTIQIEDFTVGKINGNKRIVSSPVLHSNIIDRFQNCNPEDKKMIKMELVDLPGVYHFLDKNFSSIFDELYKLEKYDFFNNKAIQALIDLNYPHVRKAILIRLILPFFVFHIIFVSYLNVVYENRIQDDDYYIANIVLGTIQLAFSVYFLFNELKQIGYTGFSYLKSFWNYIDILAPCGVIILHSFQYAEFSGYYINPDLTRVILSVSTFLMWIKFLSIFRIFDATNYLIRTVYEVVKDMGVFLFVLLITVAGFGDAFLRLSEGNEEEEKFIESFIPAVLYAYSMILGGYDTTAFGEVAQPMVWIFWVLCTVLDLIVMLNLLIAIISATFERVNDNQEGASYQEKACIIAENDFMIPIHIRESYADRNKFLLISQDIEKENQVIDQEEQRYINLTSMISQNNEKQDKNYVSLSEKQDLMKQTQDDFNQQIIKRMGELKFQILKLSSKKEEIQVKCHPNVLTKMLLFEVQELYGADAYQFWSCYCKKFTGCKSWKKEQLQKQNNEVLIQGGDISTIQGSEVKELDKDNEVVYHCQICGFDYCVACFEGFPNSHIHELEKITWSILRDKYGYSAWFCDAQNFQICQRYEDQVLSDPYEALYHCKQTQFDLCVDCAKTWLYKSNQEEVKIQTNN
eukprot:403337130